MYQSPTRFPSKSYFKVLSLLLRLLLITDYLVLERYFGRLDRISQTKEKVSLSKRAQNHFAGMPPLPSQKHDYTHAIHPLL